MSCTDVTSTGLSHAKSFTCKMGGVVQEQLKEWKRSEEGKKYLKETKAFEKRQAKPDEVPTVCSFTRYSHLHDPVSLHNFAKGSIL